METGMSGEIEATELEPWHDPELRFLDALEQEVKRRAERAAIRHEQRERLSFSGLPAASSRGSDGGRSAPTSAPFAAKGRPSRAVPQVMRHHKSLHGPIRVARRSLTLMALLCLIGASAYGASEVFSQSAPSPLGAKRGAFAPVAQGTAGSEAWKLQLYMRGAELCRVLSVAEAETSDCAPPPFQRQVQATSAQSPSRSYVFGITGASVMSVSVRIGDAQRVLRTEAPDRRMRRLAGLPPHIRFYLATTPRPRRGEGLHAIVQGVGAAGAHLGKPIASCLETGEPGRC